MYQNLVNTKIDSKYPVSKAAAQVLVKLNVTVENAAQAEDLFQTLGIVVVAKRVGRASVPAVTISDGVGGFTRGGDGEYTKNKYAAEMANLLAEFIN